MSKENSKKGPENWPMWKLISVVWGSYILFFVLLFLAVGIGNVLLGYVVFGIYILLGIAMVIKAESVGSAIFESSYQGFEWFWRRVLKKHMEDIQKRLNEMESGPLGYNFHIVIAFFIGLGLIAISIWAIVMLAQGKMF